VIARDTLPPSLRAFAFAGDDGEIMAVAHRTHPVVGVQFHPESAATEYGYWIIDRFLTGTRARKLPTGADGADAKQDASRRPSTPFVPPPVELVR